MVFFLFFSLLIVFSIIIFQQFDSSTKIVFCDVGQGDAAYLRIKNKIDLLIDAGPDRKILDCLGKYMPFYDRKIELAIFSHPDKDHIGGLIPLLDRYKISLIYSVPVNQPTQTFFRLKKKIIGKKIPIFYPSAGHQVKLFNDLLEFYWPEKNILSDTNDLSSVFLFKENGFKVLFTGDISLAILERLLKQYKIKAWLLKIPHHGSKNNLSAKALSLADPDIAVITCGKNNSYGHPAKEVLDMLQAAKIKIRRTDEEGDIVFKLKVQNLK